MRRIGVAALLCASPIADLGRPSAEQRRDLYRLSFVSWRLGRGARTFANEIEHQCRSASRGHRLHLVQAVRVEGRESDFGRLVALELEAHLPVLVPHDQLTAFRL